MPLNFITLQAPDIDKTATLYRLLGLDFVEERHGTGPRHLATETAGLALEIYPGEAVAGDGLLLGFDVEDLQDCRDRLAAACVTIASDVAERQGLLRLIALDADGRRVLVFQRSG